MFTRSCPSPDQLQQWLDSELESNLMIERHINLCSSCQDQLERLTCCAMATVSLAPLTAGLQKFAETTPLQQPEDLDAEKLDSDNTPQEIAFPALPGYQFIRRLGQGGMGHVYLAKHLKLDRLVAVKVLRADLAIQSNFVSRLKREAKALAALKHPNVLQVFEVANEKGIHALILEYLPDGNLKQRRESQAISPQEACRIMIQVLKGVQAIHEQGIVHRDLKPSNILLDGTTPKVADFGLAYMTTSNEQLTATDDVFGTPEFMAPEQIQQGVQSSSVQSDIYSLGAVLYELLCGKPPLVGKTAYQTMELVTKVAPEPPRQMRAGIPARLEQICLRALHKKPEQRFGSAQELADCLEEVLRSWHDEEVDSPTLERSNTVLSTPRKWWHKNRLVAAAVVAGLVLLAIWSIVAKSGNQPASVQSSSQSSSANPMQADWLPAGSHWQGTFTFLPAAEGEIHGDAELDVLTREGSKFSGIYYSEQRKYVWRIQGVLNGREIHWEYVSAIQDSSAGDVVGNVKVSGAIEGRELKCTWKQRDETARILLYRVILPGTSP